MVPAPTNSPMPESRRSDEYRGRVFSVYLRPWTLNAAWSTDRVPHLQELNVVPGSAQDGTPQYSYAAAWSNYIQNGVVSRHAQRIIVQFMLANCGRSGRQEDLQNDAEVRPKELCSRGACIAQGVSCARIAGCWAQVWAPACVARGPKRRRLAAWSGPLCQQPKTAPRPAVSVGRSGATSVARRRLLHVRC